MRRQLLVLVAATTSLVLVAFLVPLAVLLKSEAEDRAVTLGTQQAQALAAEIGSVGVVGAQSTIDQFNATPDFHTSVFLADGEVFGAPAERLPSIELAGRGQAFSTNLPDSQGGGRAVLVPVQGLPDGTAVIQVAVTDNALHRGVTRAWLIVGGLGAALLVLAVLLADQLGRQLVRSVSRVAAVSDQLASGDLDARVEPQGPPEVRKVGAGLNRLATRIGELLAAEREEVADLSHRLRTPVTALRLDVDSLREPEEAARLSADLDELARTVDEVIRSARRPVREGVGASGDLAAVVGERAGFWFVLAEDQGRRFDTSLPAEPVRVRASNEDLQAAVDALLGNIFAHTPEGARVRISVEPIGGGPQLRPGGLAALGLAHAAGPAVGCGGRLIVDDAGPGFESDDVLERGRSGGGSTGLGLDIVRRTAEASGGKVTLGRSEWGGARIVMDLGPPAA